MYFSLHLILPYSAGRLHVSHLYVRIFTAYPTETDKTWELTMPFEYYSTRSSTKPVTFEEAIIEGLAPDGGLYLPAKASPLPEGYLQDWKNLSFTELAVKIMSLYVSESEIPKPQLEDIVKRSYATFRDPSVTPVRELNADKQLYLLELFHGPTYAFKDVALQFLGNLFEFFLTRRNQGKPEDDGSRESKNARDTITVIGATSGDTGSAAIYGLRGKKDVDVFILYPTGRVSATQEQQMTTVLDENVRTISVPGTFDDCQDIVKALFADRAFNDKYHCGAVNSINWARILAQMTYYVKAYFSVVGNDVGKRITFVVPSGNFGDILAGFYAKEMGLPVDLEIATNSNDILYRFLQSGSYSKGSEVHATISPAMDILVSSNFERFLWHAALNTVAQGDLAEAGKIVNQWMSELKSKGTFDVPKPVLELAQKTFKAQHASDKETSDAILKTYTELSPKYVADPHTAVGIHAALTERAAHPENKEPLVVLATAHPAKFSDAVTDALKSQPGFDFESEVLPEEFKKMMTAESKKIFAKANTTDEIKKLVIESLQY